MEILITALLMGLMGSFHCAGMCGPIAIALPLHGSSAGQKVFGSLLYNSGRIITYGIMGIVFGLLGQGLELMGFQRIISIVIGSVMILAVLFPSIFSIQKFNGRILPFIDKLKRSLGRLFAIRSFQSLFLIGLLNGLLPCGLVYMAVAGSIGTGNAVMGMFYMLLFGLGTIPMLLIINLSGNLITAGIRKRLNRLIPALVILVGLLFVLRGLSLGIPYLSPSEEKIKMRYEKSLTGDAPPARSDMRDCCKPAK
jgi:uncharacterized protein